MACPLLNLLFRLKFFYSIIAQLFYSLKINFFLCDSHSHIGQIHAVSLWLVWLNINWKNSEVNTKKNISMCLQNFSFILLSIMEPSSLINHHQSVLCFLVTQTVSLLIHYSFIYLSVFFVLQLLSNTISLKTSICFVLCFQQKNSRCYILLVSTGQDHQGSIWESDDKN